MADKEGRLPSRVSPEACSQRREDECRCLDEWNRPDRGLSEEPGGLGLEEEVLYLVTLLVALQRLEQGGGPLA